MMCLPTTVRLGFQDKVFSRLPTRCLIPSMANTVIAWLAFLSFFRVSESVVLSFAFPFLCLRPTHTFSIDVVLVGWFLGEGQQLLVGWLLSSFRSFFFRQHPMCIYGDRVRNGLMGMCMSRGLLCCNPAAAPSIGKVSRVVTRRQRCWHFKILKPIPHGECTGPMVYPSPVSSNTKSQIFLHVFYYVCMYYTYRCIMYIY